MTGGAPSSFSGPITVDLELCSRYDTACETFLLIDQSRHQVLLNSWPWLEWCRSRAPRESRLGVYRHRETGRFVLGNWVYSPDEATNPVMMEMESFSASPNVIWPRDLLDPALMSFRLRPAEEHTEKFRKRAWERKQREKAEREERAEFRLSRSRWLRQKGLSEAAHRMEIGETPLAKPTAERREMWIDNLKSMRRTA